MTSLQLSPTHDRSPAAADPTPSLRVVPEWPAPLGAGLLVEETDLDQDLVVRARQAVTHDVVTLVLEPTVPGVFAFAPGQYLTLAVDVDGVPTERCYTISSPPTRPHLLTITVKRVPGGVVSQHLHDRLRVGDVVSARGPLGGFTVAAHPAARYLLLSAGSGITPTLSTVRAMADLAELDRTDVVVVHSARTPSDLACRAELDGLAAAHAGLTVVWVCEDDPDGVAGPWSGRLSAELLRHEVPDLAEREVFTCGPTGYMDAVRSLLPEVGADPARCHEESFVLPAAPPVQGGSPEVVAPVGESTTATITFARSGCEVACPRGTTVLTAAEQAGVRLPSSCASGLCGTCKSTLLSGRVDMSHQGGIRPREIAQDRFLPCCSTPDGDIVVDA